MRRSLSLDPTDTSWSLSARRPDHRDGGAPPPPITHPISTLFIHSRRARGMTLRLPRRTLGSLRSGPSLGGLGG